MYLNSGKVIITQLFAYLLCYIQNAVSDIRIREMLVPESLENGSVNEVILDCDFEADGEEGVEVKWFYNGLVDQIYQWIPETNKPGQAVGRLRDKIDVNYRINDDNNTMYRALHIVNVTPDMSGNYTCKVSSYMSEDMETKEMIIYVPPDEHGLSLTIDEEESLIYCTASGIYPQPNIEIYIDDEDDATIASNEEHSFDDDSGLFNVTAILFYNPEKLKSPFQYICELSIPGTQYQMQKSRQYYLQNHSNVIGSERISLFISVFFLFVLRRMCDM